MAGEPWRVGGGTTIFPDMSERRFNEAEVAAIFGRAAESLQTGQHQLPSGEGMTLTELQAIGGESRDLTRAAGSRSEGDRTGRELTCAKLSMRAGS